MKSAEMIKFMVLSQFLFINAHFCIRYRTQIQADCMNSCGITLITSYLYTWHDYRKPQPGLMRLSK